MIKNGFGFVQILGLRSLDVKVFTALAFAIISCKAIRQREAELHKFKLSVMKIYSRERKSSEGLQGKVKK